MDAYVVPSLTMARVMELLKRNMFIAYDGDEDNNEEIMEAMELLSSCRSVHVVDRCDEDALGSAV